VREKSIFRACVLSDTPLQIITYLK
jgi:hypothetical protein